jgi:hypothetical protein
LSKAAAHNRGRYGISNRIDDLRLHIRFPIPGSDVPENAGELAASAKIFDEAPPTSVQPEFDLWMKQPVSEEPTGRAPGSPDQKIRKRF